MTLGTITQTIHRETGQERYEIPMAA